MDDFSAPQQLNQSNAFLQELVGEDISAIEVASSSAAEAPFFARIVSKLSPLVGNLLEQRIVTLLDENSSDGYSWHRQDPGFPDAVLMRDADNQVLAGYEIKAWYVLSTEITGRFKESLNLLRGRNINVVIVAWCLSHLVFGKPRILGILTVSAEELASSRDTHYYNPPNYLVIEPTDTSERTINLRQSNVNGYALQKETSDSSQVEAALKKKYFIDEPHSERAQSEAEVLRNKLSYRLDTNFAKIDRLKNVDVMEFKDAINSSIYLKYTVREWKQIIKLLDSKDASQRKHSESLIVDLYDALDTNALKTTIVEESPNVH
ncbi:hypothetical protein CRD17_02510 [Corynebacterium sp. LK30]|nr:hypothetical protein [Corynebacterium sp. LK30]